MEIVRQTYKKTAELLDTKVDQLRENEQNNDDKIRMIVAEKSALSASQESGKGSLIDPIDMASIEQTTRAIYVDCFKRFTTGQPRTNLQDDPNFKKAAQMDCLQVMGEIEGFIDKMIGRLKMSSVADSEIFDESKKKVRLNNKKLKQ